MTITSKTFDLDTIPKEREVVIPIQVVFKANMLSDSTLDNLKTCVVVRGCIQQKYCILSDMHTWVATAGFKILRRFLAEAAKRGRKVRQFDFIATFFQGKIQGRLLNLASVSGSTQ